MAKRLEEFDVLKGIGILLVVLGHCEIGDAPSRVIFSFHMPLFIMVSGFFFYRQPPVAFLKKTAMRLLVPWLFFALLNVLYAIGFGLWSTHDIQASIVDTFSRVNPWREYSHLVYRSIWFLVVLFFAGNIYNLMGHLLARLRMDDPRVLDAVVLLSFIAGYLLQRYLDLPLYVDVALSVVIYYHLGARLKPFLTRARDKGVWMSPWLSLVVFAGLMCVPAFTSVPKVNIKLNLYPWWLPLFEIPVFIAMCNMVRGFCSRPTCRPLRRFLVECGKYSICFLGFHRIFMDAIYLVYGGLKPMSETLHIIIYFVILIPLVLWLSRLLERHAPLLVGFKRH